MKRKLPNEVLSVLECWFSVSKTCVKWNTHISKFFKLIAGVRQGGVLSPLLFAILLTTLFRSCGLYKPGCSVSFVFVNIFLYADDIVLIAPTVTGLQRILNVCEIELVNLDMHINVSKSMCIRYGPRFNNPCAEITYIHAWRDT